MSDVVVNAFVSGQTTKSGFVVLDNIGVDGKRHVSVLFNGTDGLGSAYTDHNQITSMNESAAGASYAGTMVFTPWGAKKSTSYAFNWSITAPNTVSFTMKTSKGDLFFSDNGVLTGTIVLN